MLSKLLLRSNILSYIDETEWSDWSDWTQCSVLCGDGTKSRNRTCFVGEDNEPCIGNNSGTVTCNDGECPGR